MSTFRLVIGDRKNKTFSKLLFHSNLKCEHLLLAKHIMRQLEPLSMVINTNQCLTIVANAFQYKMNIG